MSHVQMECIGWSWLPKIKTYYEATDCDVTKERIFSFLFLRVKWLVYIRPRREDE